MDPIANVDDSACSREFALSSGRDLGHPRSEDGELCTQPIGDLDEDGVGREGE